MIPHCNSKLLQISIKYDTGKLLGFRGIYSSKKTKCIHIAKFSWSTGNKIISKIDMIPIFMNL